LQHTPLSTALVLTALALPRTATAGFPGVHVAESLVVGANLTVALGAEQAGLGWGVDFGWQRQWYTQQGEYLGEVYHVWPDAHIAPNLGVMAHLSRVGGAWQASVDARGGVTKPLRVGLQGGWWPGASVAAEVGYLISTAGYAGLDLQGVVEATWLQARFGQALTLDGWRARRIHLGAFAPIQQPRLWPESENVGWHPPE